MSNKNVIVIHHNLGLGDHIICNGLVRSLLNEGKHFSDIIVFAKEVNAKNVTYMFADDPRIHIITIPINTDEWAFVNHFMCVNKHITAFIRSQNIIIDNLISMGLVSNFDEGFYSCCGIPFEYRWKKFKTNRNIDEEMRVSLKLNPNNEKYMFVHDEPSLGYNITKIENPNNLKIIKNDTTESIFNMVGIMENASEIHCMESSIRCLIDHLPNINCPLYLHKIRDHGLVSTTKSKWISIEY